MTKINSNVPGNGMIAVFAFVSLLILLASCSDDNPTEPDTSVEAIFVIDASGGSVSLDNKIHLYVPEGSISLPTAFELEELFSPPQPPDGFMQVGPAFTATPADGGVGGLLALAMEFDYPFTGEFSGRMLRLSRWNYSGEWIEMDTQGSYFPLGLGVTVSELGTFAAHIDTSSIDPEEVLAMITLSSSFGMMGTSPDPSWKTLASAHFWNFDRTEKLTNVGSTIRMGSFQLDFQSTQFGYHSYQHEVPPGSSYHVRFSGGDEVPALNDTLHYFAEELVLTNPSDPYTEISKLEPYTITWDGAGPQLVWLMIYGTGADGSFLHDGSMRPNTGEFTLTPDFLTQFEDDAQLNIFLQRYQTRSMQGDGFHRSSFFLVESSSVMKVVVK